MSIADELATARAKVANLEQAALTATCAEFGRHRWVQMGGCNCGCNPADGWCSLPVYECSVCKRCDYGENAEATAMREECCGRK